MHTCPRVDSSSRGNIALRNLFLFVCTLCLFSVFDCVCLFLQCLCIHNVAVSKLREKLYLYEENWFVYPYSSHLICQQISSLFFRNLSMSLLANLQLGLDLTFPSPSTSASNEVLITVIVTHFV